MIKNEIERLSVEAADNDNFNPKLSFKDSIPQIVASCAINFIVIQAGINMSFSSILIPQLSSPESDIKIDLDSSSTVASIVTLSIALGALCSGSFMDILGRKRLSAIICLPFMCAWLLIALSRNLYMIYVARVLSGFCGGLTTVALVYVGEISCPQYRGMLLCLNSVFVSLGIILTYFLNIYFAWRTIGFIFSAFSLFSLLIIMQLPESPNWIVSLSTRRSRKNSDALRSLEWIYRNHHISSFYYHQLIDNEKLRQSNLLAEQSSYKGKSLAGKVLTEPQVYKPLIILLFLFLLQQASGGYILIFYTINIFRNSSLNFSHGINENMALIMLGTLRLVVSVIASGMARKCRRKILLYISSLGMMIFIFVAGILLHNIEDRFPSSKNFLNSPMSSSSPSAMMSDVEDGRQIYLLIMILCYIAFSSLGVMVLPWTLISELFPIEVKGKMAGVVVFIAYTLMFFVVKIFPYSVNLYGMEVMFYFFAISSFILCSFVYYFLPETFAKSLNDIHNHFVRK